MEEIRDGIQRVSYANALRRVYQLPIHVRQLFLGFETEPPELNARECKVCRNLLSHLVAFAYWHSGHARAAITFQKMNYEKDATHSIRIFVALFVMSDWCIRPRDRR
jgi:hypothetical protein